MERRSFMIFTAAVFTELFIGASGFHLNQSTMRGENETFLKENNPDPLFRAATLSVLNNNWGVGRASLVEVDNDYIIFTAKHVAVSVKKDPYIQIPSVGIFPLNTREFRFLEKPDEPEPCAYYPLSSKLKETVSNAVGQSILNPLRISKKLITPQEHLVIANSVLGSYDLFISKKFHQDLNLWELEGNLQRPVCSGQSGSPVLRLSENYHTLSGEITGVVMTAVDNDSAVDPTPLNKSHCGITIGIRSIEDLILPFKR